MIKWYFSFLAIVVLALVILIFQFGLNPRPKPVIKPSNFSNFHVIGQTIFKQLHKDIHSSKVVAFGINKSFNLDIILSLLHTSQSYKKNFHTVLILSPMKSEWENKAKHFPSLNVRVEHLTQNYTDILRLLKKQQTQLKKTLMIATPEDVFHPNAQSLVSLLELDLGVSILSFIAMESVFDLEKLRQMQSLCRQQSKVDLSFSHLSCIAYQESRWLKKLKTNKINKDQNIVFLKQYRDYIYFTYLPYTG